MKKKLILLSMSAGFIAQNAQACTGLIMKSKDNGVVYGRTMEFNTDLKSNLIIIPENKEMSTISAFGEGLKYKTKYAVIGMNGLGLNIVADGVNEKGMAGGLFFFPGEAKYQTYNKSDSKSSMSSTDILTYLLTNYADTDEVKKAIGNLKVNDTKLAAFGNMTVPLHYSLTDAKGKSIVIEYTATGLHVYDNNIHVVTNSPSFPWHLENINNYANLAPIEKADHNAFGDYPIEYKGMGITSNGLPGSYSSPSRFVRVAFYVNNSPVYDTVDETMKQGRRILNNFDIPDNASSVVENNVRVSEVTEWTSMVDLKNKTYTVRMRDSEKVLKFTLDDKMIHASDISIVKIDR